MINKQNEEEKDEKHLRKVLFKILFLYYLWLEALVICVVKKIK